MRAGVDVGRSFFVVALTAVKSCGNDRQQVGIYMLVFSMKRFWSRKCYDIERFRYGAEHRGNNLVKAVRGVVLVTLSEVASHPPNQV